MTLPSACPRGANYPTAPAAAENHHSISTTSPIYPPPTTNGRESRPRSFDSLSNPSSTSTAHKHKKRTSHISVSTNSSARSHQEYLDSLEVPTPEMVERITEVQEQKEKEVIKRKLGEEHGKLSDEEREQAAGIIQRNYRGHRERRILAGMSLDPSTRWVEAVKEAQYRNLTTPRKREFGDINQGGDGAVRQSMDTLGTNGTGGSSDVQLSARQNWKKIGFITRRAGGDEDSDSDSSGNDDKLPADEREKRRKQKIEAKAKRQKAAKMMDLQYFLEMVDLKHRYGSNLRTYHEEWLKSDTRENFFYWLDYGEGRFIDCQGCPRSRLDSERVRYLSKEERLSYLVKIDGEGRLCWAKNGVRIDTTEKFKDSIHGIVAADDDTPAFRPADGEAATGLQDHHHHHHQHQSSDESESESEEEADTDARANKYATPDFDNAKGVKKVKHVSAATIFNKLLRGSVKKNTWIFVADTSFRLYVGIKQSGAFQHSSFLHGSRISAAGLIKIKNGRLSKLSPLSGHYRPPVSNFRAFIHSLKEAGVDMSHVSISRSYAVLVGLEAYVKTRKRGKKLFQNMVHKKDKLVAPQAYAKHEEEVRDKSESAERERRFLEAREQTEAEEREENRVDLKILRKLSILPQATHYGVDTEHDRAAHEEKQELGKDTEVQVPGTGPEQAIAPEGTRTA